MTDETKDPEEFTESVPPLSAPPAEAGFSTNFHLTHDRTGPIQFTFRGAYSSDWHDVLADVSKFVKHMTELGYRFNVPQPAPPPVANKAAEIAASEGNAELAQAITEQAAEVPPPPHDKVYQTVDIQEIAITPQADGLIKLEFWNPGRKYPEEYLKGKPERVAGLLKHITSADVNKAQKLSVACKVYYVFGKEKTNKPGEYWHDLMHVRRL